MKRYQQYIDGEWCDASDGKMLTSINPSNEECWDEFPEASEEDVNRSVEAARRALYDGPWSRMTATMRGELLFRLAELVREQATHLGEIETIDSGKLARETRAQTAYVGDYYRYFAGLADKIEGKTLPIDKPDMHVFTTRVPIGVVAAVVPWNAQMFLTATKLGPALAAGNTVVVKASEEAPAAMFEFARLVEEAGFPPGVVNVISGLGDPCGRALTSHPGVSRVAFTGGPKTAQHVIANTANNFAVVSLELGGKSPILVFDDADINGAVNGIIAGNFGASGQSCVAGSRVIIQSGIYNEILSELEGRARQIVVGDPLDESTQVGPLATRAQIDRIVAAMLDIDGQTASIRYGGRRPPEFPKGFYFMPTIVECSHQQVTSVRNEMFGPVMSILRFDTEEEGLALANDTLFGLGAGIFTENLSRAHRVSARIQAGIVWINTYRAISPIAPFGGFGMSGYGREAGLDSIEDYTRSKTTWINTASVPMANPFVMR